ncbi:lytic transglycosylase domain-containing protein [Yersinia ruckeri]|uniref:lytic transglycosylase domain-containing protein n=1 Tax=Yersinia ruckeri TaxID=29486 RepID=UPI00223861A6|nr:lytic transglycosylase domain-containing protein [Yersinia ruckeri]MCW6600807.1 lytic transglycosylase domain-containing protein [Yersinia ruckeri]MCW6607226.1 lytic transglycosylase domain-containing protein [Yersinia ruckeri]MCW6614213.1 lytic transglycosylase domain-containing protein [Yersinia ruckeri]
MSNAETIKDFLVSLGFELDEAGEKKFSAVVAGVTANVLKMGAVVEGAALAVVGFTTKIASGLDKVYFASQRTGASVAGIKALGYAASQLGVDAASAQGSLESLARFIRNSPGAEGFLNRLGIQTRSANGSMRDTSAIFTGLSAKLSSMPYYRANQYAQMLGIDENTLMAMRKGLGQFSSEYALTAKKIGFNAEVAAKQSNRFMTSMRDLSMTLGQARDKIGSNLADGLAGDIDSLRKQLLDNWPKIEAVLMKVIKGILWAGDAVSRVLWRTGQAVGGVINWFKKLDPITQQLIVLFGGLLVAWRLLNTAFLTSPIGIVSSLGVALFALYDDYKTWKEGGSSLIDWGQWEQEINAALKGMDDLTKSIKGVGVEIARLLNINLKNWTLKGDIENLTKQFGEFGKMLSMIGDLINALKEGNWSEVGRIGKLLLSQGSDQPDAMPVVTDSANSAADWVKDKTGFDPRSVGRWLRGEGDSTDPRGIRNNNPGNINYVGQDGASLERPGGRFAKFETAYDGLKAMARQLMRYFTGKTTGKPLQTLNDIISTWAPGSENNTGAYVAQLSKMLNVHPDAVLNLENPQVMSALMGGIIHHENGRNPYSSELISRAAGGMQQQGLQQETNIYITGVSDPVSAGNEVAGRQTNVNARLTQQLSTPTR